MAANLISACHKRVRAWSELVAFIHAIFVLPFMAASLVLASQQAQFSGVKLLWIIIAHLSARHVAMLVNRLADYRLDALNPRTKSRGLVSGLVSRKEAYALLLANLLLFLLCCFMLNWLCLLLAPLALAIICGYSYSKRFTSLCHLWLGLACALGAMGAWVAITGNFSPVIWPLGLGCALWVAGFDVLYAMQDIDFDRAYGLYSLPARLGRRRALMLSRLMHLAATLSFASLYLLFNFSWVYLLGCALMALGLFYQQFISRRHNLSPAAFTGINGVIALSYLTFVLISLKG